MAAAGHTIEVLLDVDVGMRRTGTTAARGAGEIYRMLADLPGVQPAGLHIYDGQNHQTAFNERRTAVLEGAPAQ